VDGTEPQRDRRRGVVLLLDHPGQPAFEVLPLEVIETDAGTIEMLDLAEVGQEGFQADPVGLDRLR